jgi:hypothetical protein
LYQANNLSELLKKTSTWDEYHSVRFVVRKDDELIFSLPFSAYFQLAIEGEEPRGAVEFIAAGNAQFDQNGCLTRISRANCDELYIPHVSLHFALKAFVKDNVPLADNVAISSSNGEARFSKEEILKTYQVLNNKNEVALTLKQ